MLQLANIRIRPKLLMLFVFTGLLPLIVVSYLYNSWSEKALVKESFKTLQTAQTIRKAEIEDYFTRSFANVRLLADSERIYNFYNRISRYRDAVDLSSRGGFETDSPLYGKIVKNIQKPLQDYTFLNGYDDLYLIDADYGHVMFSVRGGSDNGTNLRHAGNTSGGLAEVWRRVLATGRTVITDFAPYEPAQGEEVAFLGHPVTNKSGLKIGVVVLRFKASLISSITDSRKGMGKTGESYIIGYDGQHERFELRSNMTTMGGGDYVVGYYPGISLDYWEDALARGNPGGRGTYVDSDGKAVLVAFNRLNIQGLDWYLISKIDRYEVTASVRRIFKKIFAFALFFVVLTSGWAWILSRGFTRPVLGAIGFADAIAHGRYGSQLPAHRKDELGDLARSLNAMADGLREVDWLTSGKKRLDDTMRGELALDQLARNCIGFFVHYFEAQLGALYVNNRGTLELLASSTFTDRPGKFNTYAMGEGIVGQAAVEGETVFFSKIEEDVPHINYGAGEQAPAHFMAVPIAADGDVVAVMLLGAMRPVTETEKKFVNQNSGNIAILFNAARSRARIAELLATAQKQRQELQASNAELEKQAGALRESKAELQSQQEELRVTNEELEEQTRALKKSERHLQSQQEELRVANEELEERSRELERQKNEVWEKNSDLEEARQVVENKVKELEIAGKYKSEFLANMSHELRTPLNSILILSQLLGGNKDGNLSPKQLESAQAIHSSGSELLALINEILDLSKVEAGRVELTIEKVPLASITSDLNRLYKDIAESKGVRFSIDVADDLPECMETDGQRLQQVLRNLLTNAFKFTAEGEIALIISRPTAEQLTNTSLAMHDSLALSVRDQGIGIAEDKQQIIFEAFQQADGSTSRDYGGTGLGLSISRELARLLGGTMRLHSIAGEGSTFTLVLPQQYKKDDAPPPVEETIAAAGPFSGGEQPGGREIESETTAMPLQRSGATQSSGEVADDRKNVTPGCKSLLIIEDDNTFSRILRDFARERGFLAVIAEDGETGLHFADYYRPSAIILDIGLPGINGWTVMERLKENPELRHIPVHFMSAAESSLDALRMGAIGYLTKPVSMEKMAETFTKLEHMIAKPVSRLLLVEDDATQRASIKELIGNSDVETMAVGSAARAYEELDRGSYDCMILDLGLEDMSGFELLEKIRKDPSLAGLPIIIYTGRELTEDEEKQLRRYAESIIIKGAKSPERLLDESALFLHRIEADLPEEKRKMLQTVHEPEGVLSGSTVLLVDDDMRNVFALTSVLEERQVNVVIARDGIECLEKLEEHDDIAAVLMDIMMPRMDGFEAMREIRSTARYTDLPIIALTAKAMKGDRNKCIEAGASDYLAKPVDYDKLLSMLRVWLYR
ncbi:MAG: response regulator [Desulfopila sp.]